MFRVLPVCVDLLTLEQGKKIHSYASLEHKTQSITMFSVLTMCANLLALEQVK
jgi:hypothetical protein